MEIGFIAAATRKDRSLKPFVNFVKKRNWNLFKFAYRDYWYNVCKHLFVKEDSLLLDERIIIPKQLRETILDSIHLTHPGAAAKMDPFENIWIPHVHRLIFEMAQNCTKCTEQGGNLKPNLGQEKFFQMDLVVEPNKEV